MSIITEPLGSIRLDEPLAHRTLYRKTKSVRD